MSDEWQVPKRGSMSDRDPAASASLDELVAVNIAGDIEDVADGLNFAPLAQAKLRKFAAGVRALDTDRGSR